MKRSPLVSLIGIVGVAVVLLALTFILGNTPKLGLDLQGGASVVLQPDGPADNDALNTTVDIIRNRVDALGVAEPEITRQGNAIVVNLPGVKDQERARQLVGQTAELRFRPVLEVLGPDPNQAVPDFGAITSTTVPSTPTETTVPGATTTTPATTAPAADTTAPAVTTTAAAGGPGNALPLPRQDATTTTPTATPATAAPVTTTTVAGATTTAGPTTTSAPIPTTIYQTTPPEQDLADQTVVLEEKDSKGKVTDRYLLGPAFLLGSAVESASAVFTTEWQVNLTIRAGADGIEKWNQQAQLCFNGDVSCPGSPGQIAIVLDGIVQSAPRIQPDNISSGFVPFTRDQISISGNMGQKEAQNLALVLKYGSLPVKLKQQAVQTVSATLGKDSLRAGLIAGGIGIGLVILFMFAYYRTLALVVVAGLLVSAALVWSVIAYLGESRGLALSLAGATGIIVSIGVTVDSYVVYFERLKDDVRSGRTLRNSATRGFKAAYRTIIAADLVSLLGAGVLWYLTVGSVRGFAFFLGLSTIMDMIVAYFFTRPAVILLSRSRFLKGSKVLGVTAGEGAVAGARS
jgi:preprotein translocase subunit SecD